MNDEYLRQSFYTLIEPLTSQYETFFVDEEGNSYDPISSLNDIFFYLMTDAYEKHLKFVMKLGQEIGAGFNIDRDMLLSDEVRDKVLLRENLNNFLVRSKAHIENILHEEDKEIEDKIAKGLLVEKDKTKPKGGRSAYKRKYDLEHKAEISAYKKGLYQKNKEKIKAKSKTYYHENKDEINEKRRY